ncbi:SapC protein [Dyella jiangningensis]|uniref:SapC family protein n=1 Tax=Dyella sp. AtDHG13 TaxID=1938897 RepID=UPI00088E96EE|nr:SapC family protein [Dyella sp. AtDHG13]PXV54723.1 SapC protein [Dyella sp. AtDHG13]SDK87350.1 SapC protein [Dyella jiangningensis]
MAEVLFYERPVPLNRTEHKDLRIKPIPNLKFASAVHSVPLTGVEFPAAARDLPILFGGLTVESAGPLALLGLRENENLFIDAEGRWVANTYIPAFVRRYPFVLAEKPAGAEGDDFTVFLDEAYEGFDRTEGEALFKDDGSETEVLSNAVRFLGEYQQHVARTQWFMEQLRKHNLLEPRNIRLEKDGKSINLNGLFVVNEEKLRQLDEKTTHEFLREGVLGWIYAHLLSLSNIDRVSQRLSEREQVEEAATALKN